MALTGALQTVPNFRVRKYQINISLKKKWQKILEKWVLAQSEGLEILSMGDFNLNKFSWEKQESEKSLYEIAQTPMIQDLKSKILNNGFSVLNNEPTWDLTSNPGSCLDLIITNRVDKIVSFQTKSPTFSDHSLQVVIKRTKELKNQKQFIKTRYFKNYSREVYIENVQNHPLLIDTLYEPSPTTIAQNIQKIVRDSLDPIAPLKMIQVSLKKSKKLSTEARELLAKRDSAFTEWKISGDPQQKTLLKNLRNQANKMIFVENLNNKKKSPQNQDLKYSKEKWNKLKMESGQKKCSTPTLIIENNTHHTAPKQIAQALNRLYVQEIRKVVNEMPPPLALILLSPT